MSYTNILEGARQYFQGLPSANTGNPAAAAPGQQREAGNVAPQSPAGPPPPQSAATQQPQQPPPALQQPQQPQAAPQWPSHSAPGQPPPAPDLRWAKPLDATQAQYYPQYNVPQQQQQQNKYPAEMYNNVAQKNNYNNFNQQQQQSGKAHNNVAYQYPDKSKQPVANSYMYNHTAPGNRGQQQPYDVKSSIPTPVNRVSGQQQAYDIKSNVPTPVNRVSSQQQVYDVKSSIPTPVNRLPGQQQPYDIKSNVPPTPVNRVSSQQQVYDVKSSAPSPVNRVSGQQQAYDMKSSISTPVSRVSGQQQVYDVKSSVPTPVNRVSGQQQAYDMKSGIPRAPSNHDGRHYERNNMVNSSSPQSNYPTMSSIDRAFAQYSSPKMLPTTSSPATTASTFLANRASTSYPAHYNMTRPVHSKPAYQEQKPMAQPSPKPQQQQQQQQQQQPQQFNQKLHQYYQYNSQMMPTTQQQQQYPTMTNPTASWVQNAMGQQQQYRQVSQQQQQQQALPQHQLQQQFVQPAARQQTQHHPMVSEANSSQHLVSMAHHMSKERPMQHDQHAQMLQRPKLPPPRPQQTPRAPGVRRDSPLDLSVRTIRRSADSTLDDERGTPEHPLAPPPDTSRMQQPDLSLQSLLRSSENALLPPFQRFRQGSLGGSMGETKSPCASSTLLSMEHKFGPRVTAAAETLTSLAHQQYTPRQQYIPPRSIREGHATPHLAAHALAQQQQQHAASQFRPNSGGHSAADKRVLSILRNSLEERSNQQKLMLAAQQQQQQQQQQNAAVSGNMAAQHRPQGPRPGLDHSQLLRQHMQASPQAALPLPATVQELPPSSQHPSSELDGLAAFLAARIRTKAELKQCGDAHQSLQATPGGGAAAPGAAHRTRGDCPCGEENCGCPVQSMTLAVTSRKVSETRSSTETSVFDFPDSDPEMAAPASVSDLRRHRKPPSTDIPMDCPPGASTPGPSAAAAPPPPPPVEEDPAWASLCTNFVTSLETKGAKTSRAGIQALNTARKRKAEASEEPSKVPKLEVKPEPPKPEPKVLKEEMELIQSCLKVSSDCEKLLETIPPVAKQENNSDSDVVNKKSSRKIVVESSSSSESESDSEESLNLAARQQQRLQEFLSSSESTNSSSEDSDWSDDVGKAVAVRLRERNTRNKSRAYSIRTRLRSQRKSPPAKRPGRPRRKIVKSPSSDSEEEKSESPKPRRTRQRHSPSPISTRKTRRKSKSPVSTITTRLRNKSKSPTRKKSKSPPITRQTRRKSKSPEPKEPKRQSPISTTVKKSKSPPPVATRQSRRQSKSPVTGSRDPGFYPGWDSDLVKFKQSWRMPSNLIMVHSRPNSDPPTPTKKRRGCTNSPISCASDPGISGNLRSLASRKILRDFDTSDSSNSTPVKVRKPMIRDVELSDSSNSLPFRPRRNESSSAKTLKDRRELFAKLADKIKGRGRKKQVECEEEEVKITREESDDDKKPKLRRGLRQRRRSSRLSGSLDKRLLRSAAIHRSNRALINSKRHLRRRDLKATDPVIVKAKRGPKGRRKLRSSGFDYLRKKKKKKEERDTKRVIGIPGLRQVSGSVEEVANEVRAWVVNKGLGETVLHQAARKNHDDAVAYLLELQGMDPSVKDNAGFTPLHIASARGFLSTARLLLLYGARVDSSAQGGIRPLHEAVECGHVEVCRLLLSYGADPGLAKYSGATPLKLASTPEVRQLLKDHIADMQGTQASPWDLRNQWDIDSVETTGFNVIEDPPASPALSDHDFEFEDVSSEHAMTAPASWWLPGESEPLMLLLEVCSTLGHGLDWLRRALRSDVTTKDIPRSQFNETARPVQLLATNWKPSRQLCVSEPNQNDSLLTLIRADDKLRSLLEAASYARSRASR